MDLFITSRDCGSALQNMAFAEHCLELTDPVNLMILCQSPADEIFLNSSLRNRGIQIHVVEDTPTGRNEAVRALDRFSPDFVLVGFSTNGGGVDEVIAKRCKEVGLPSGAIQDYWGYTGQFDDQNFPSTIFCLDDRAKELTEFPGSARSECFITGSPKHERYKELIAEWERHNPFKKSSQKTLVYFPQPMYLPGMKDNFDWISDELSKVQDVDIYFKPHPGDPDSASTVRSKWNSSGLNFNEIDSPQRVEPYLVHADVVLTHFSTVGIDHNYLQLYSQRPLGNLIYAASGTEIRSFMRESIGVGEVPSVAVGVGREISEKGTLAIAIRDAVENKSTESLYQDAVKRMLGNSMKPSSTIWTEIKRLTSQRLESR